MRKVPSVFRRSLLLISVIVLCFTSAAGALPPEQRRLFDSGVLYFDAEPGSGLDCSIGNNVHATDGVMSLFYPGFVDEAAIAASMEAHVRKYHPDSPWLSEINDFATKLVQEGKRLNVNPLLVMILGRKESHFGTTRVTGPSAYAAKNSFGDKGGGPWAVGDYRGWPTWEASLIGGNMDDPPSERSFTASLARRVHGLHPSYVNIQNMYDYISIHVAGTLIRPEDGSTRVYDPTMGVWVDVTNVIKYHNDAQAWIGEMTGQNTQVGDSAVSSCGSTGVVNGSIVQTALGLAWTESAKVEEIRAAVQATNGLCTMTDGNHESCGQTKAAAGAFIRERDAKPEYVSAVKQFNPGNASDSSNWAFSDCGVFVATVMRGSGADSDFPVRGTGPNQLPYLLSSPKYDTVLFTDTAQLQPGDILIRDGHVAIYVGQNSITDAVVVQASWGQHVPMANQRSVAPGDGYYRARMVGT